MAFIQKSHPNLIFFAFTFGFSWLFWGILIIFQVSYSTPFGIIFHSIGGLGPLFGAIFCLFKLESKETRLSFWKRCYQCKGKKWQWLFFSIFFNFLISICVGIIELLFSTNPIGFSNFGSIIILPVQVLFILLFNFLAASMEEPGWRGCALPIIQIKYNSLLSSLILGTFWAIWHFPLYFIPDSYQNTEVIFGSPLFWIFNGYIIFPTIIMTWLNKKTDQSILSAILFHWMINVSGEVFNFGLNFEFVRLSFYVIIAIVLIWKDKMYVPLTRNFNSKSNKIIADK
ncbi:CAAX prenyl protease 2 [Candidatus Lokiarchaeum ossiferum]|uniref:CAAX prenyl protease 2 n=1 Tax=Candidatus Lokiarchaeum ossiferum TaxID=2951803 RepID=A0ABY6HT54_9ARCH|nr:CAAX prenyl protease 2 [Candidatus Lokiarchaeum sp. B-35]